MALHSRVSTSIALFRLSRDINVVDAVTR